jgi:hypothetical protein
LVTWCLKYKLGACGVRVGGHGERVDIRSKPSGSEASTGPNSIYTYIKIFKRVSNAQVEQSAVSLHLPHKTHAVCLTDPIFYPGTHIADKSLVRLIHEE